MHSNGDGYLRFPFLLPRSAILGGCLIIPSLPTHTQRQHRPRSLLVVGGFVCHCARLVISRGEIHEFNNTQKGEGSHTVSECEVGRGCRN